MLLYKKCVILVLVQSVWSIDPVVYPASVSSFRQCDLTINNSELHNILVKLKMDTPSSKTIDTDSLIHSLFEENEDIKSLYLNLTELVTVTQPERTGQTCHQNHSSAQSQQLLDALQNIISKISACPTQTVKPNFNCTNVAVSSGLYSFSHSNGSLLVYYM